MKLLEVSRRKFLQGSVALCVYAANLPASTFKKTSTKSVDKIAYLCNMCRNKCAGFARVENGVVTKLNPNPYFPKSQNMLCPKGNAGIDALYDKDRLKYPLIRIGKRGDGKYKRVTWDEAYEYIKDKLVDVLEKERDNRSTIAYCNGEGFNKDEFIQFFGGKLGSANFLDEGSICLNTKLGAEVLTLGETTQPDIDGSDFVIICGANRFESLITPDSIHLTKRKQKLTVIDPRATVTALKADRFLPINPGTDLALCLSMIYMGIRAKLYNKEFVKKHVDGFDRLKKEILRGGYTSRWAEKKTGIASKELERLTFEFFTSSRPLFYLGRRSVWAQNDFQLRRAMIILNALAGSINRKGGLVFGKPIRLPKEEVNEPIYNNAKERFDLDGIVYGSAKGGSWLNFREKVITKTAPYKIRAMFIRKHNIMRNMPDVAKTKKMLEMMDLVVVMDTMPSDTALMADVILPECTYLEREDMVVSFNHIEPSLALRNKVIEPLYESKSMQDILKGLGAKMSIELFEVSRKYDTELQETVKELGHKLNAFMDGGYDLTELYEHDVSTRNKKLIMKHFGKDVYESLRKNGVWYPYIKQHKRLANGRCEYYPEDKKFHSVKKDFTIKCYLDKLQKNGFDGIPKWRDEYDFKPKEGTFRFITGRYVTDTQSATANNVMLRDFHKHNVLWINNKEAKKLGIKHGDMVEVKSSIASVKLHAYPTNKIHPKVVWFAHGYSQNNPMFSNEDGVLDNLIIEDKFEKIYGCATMHHTDVEIIKLDKET